MTELFRQPVQRGDQNEPDGRRIVARILIIDDEPVLRMTFRHILEEEGHEVLDAEDGEVGVEVCRECHPDLVITDMIMPKQAGSTTVAILTEEFPAMPVIAMSGASVKVPHEWQGPGQRVTYVMKPVDRPALLGLVNATLSKLTKPTRGDHSRRSRNSRGDSLHAT